MRACSHAAMAHMVRYHACLKKKSPSALRLLLLLQGIKVVLVSLDALMLRPVRQLFAHSLTVVSP